MITTTGIAFLIASFGFGFCAFRFFNAFQKIGGLRSGSRIGVLLSVFFIGLAFHSLVLAIGGLFFANIPDALYALVTIDHLILGVDTALGVYLGFYVLFPRFSPWPATILTLIFGLLVTWFTITTHPLPHIVEGRSIDLGLSQWLNTYLYYLLLLNIAVPFLIFTKNLFYAKTRDVKTISIIIVILTIIGLINVSIKFTALLSHITSFQTYISDILLGVLGLLFIAAFLFFPIIAGWTSRRSLEERQ